MKYVVLYTSGHNIDWPDTIDEETGIFKYHGDNRTPGNDLHDTKKGGNLILKNLFDLLHSNQRQLIPPIFIFEKHPTKESRRSVLFKGLCVPGSNQIDSASDLVAIWKTSDGKRFQNYLAYFTILDVARINRRWIEDLNNKESYHIITDFTIIGVGSMLSPRGKSNVIFINKNLDKIIIYNLPMPENLPLYIDNNVLFFNYEKTKIGISISGGLPPELCLPKIGCN